MFLGLDTATQVEPARLRRVALAKRVGAFLSNDNSPEEIQAVTDLARVLAKDIELSVRSTLAFELRTSEHVPKDLAIRIAQDVEDVSTPFLKSTPVLTDEDLSEMIPALAEYARVAIARRDQLGSRTIDSLIKHGGAPSIARLARNQMSIINEQQMTALFGRFEGSPLVLEALSRRVDLPIQVVQRLIGSVADGAKEVLTERYGVTATAARQVTQSAGRAALFKKLHDASLDQTRAFVSDMRSENKLTDAFIIDAAKEGLTAFVESAIALKAGLTIGEARATLLGGEPSKVIPLLRDSGIGRENMASLIRELAKCYPR